MYIFYLFCAFLYAHFQQKTKTKTNVKDARGGAHEKKQTSFLTALVKNAKKPRRNEAKERIEKQKKTYIRKKLTTSKWQRSVHKFLKCPQQANLKPKTKLKTKSKRRNKPNEMQSKMHFKRTALSRASRVGRAGALKMGLQMVVGRGATCACGVYLAQLHSEPFQFGSRLSGSQIYRTWR